MPRLVYVAGVGIALVAGAFVLTDALLWRPGVTQANVRRILPGMSREQVRAILGGQGEVTAFANAGRNWCMTWTGREGTAFVHFDVSCAYEDWRVTGEDWRMWDVRFQARPNAGLLAHLRAWLGW